MVRAWFGSWLPDWRPGRDYRSTYSAQAPHPYMQKVRAIDFCFVLEGEATLVLDTQAVTLKAGERRVFRRGRQARAARKRKGEEDGKDARDKPAPRAFHTRHFFAAAVIHGSKRLPKATVASKGALLR